MTQGMAQDLKIKAMTQGKGSEYLTWLSREVRDRGWSDSYLAFRASINQSTVSRVLNGDRGLTCEFVIATSQAVGADPAWALRLANFLPDIPPSVAEEQEAVNTLRSLPPDQRSSALLMLRGLAGSGVDRPKVETGPAGRHEFERETISLDKSRQDLVKLLYQFRGLPAPTIEGGGKVEVTAELVDVLLEQAEQARQVADSLLDHLYTVSLRARNDLLFSRFAEAVERAKQPER